MAYFKLIAIRSSCKLRNSCAHKISFCFPTIMKGPCKVVWYPGPGLSLETAHAGCAKGSAARLLLLHRTPDEMKRVVDTLLPPAVGRQRNEPHLVYILYIHIIDYSHLVHYD